jgi:uncharacterized protein YjbI with pentapeptide repeats
VLEGCSLREASLQGCQFRDCLFRECDLSLVRVRGCMFRNTRWERSKAIGVNWSEATWPKGKPLFPSIDFFDSAVSYSTFSGLRLNGISIVRCVAREADFTGTDLSGADCRDTDFSDSRFIQTDLTDADFTGAMNYVISPALNTLKRTKFSFPEAISLLRALDIVLTE